MELLLGCGSQRDRRIQPHLGWKELVTLDINSAHKPDHVFDLETIGGVPNKHLPFANDTFDEIHAYEVLEHIGQQGDYRKFFAQFTEFWRVLKPDGLLCATVPSYDSLWAWGDPSHRRVINAGTLTFLCQPEYEKQVGKTSLSDFRYLYKADYDIHAHTVQDGHFIFMLKAKKPSRYVSPD